MGRYLMAIGTVSADAFVSGLTWVGQVSPATLLLALLTSGFGVVVAATTIADDAFGSSEEQLTT